MIYLLYGEDKYSLDKFLGKIKRDGNFNEESLNISSHTESLDSNKIIMDATSIPLFSANKLVLIEGALRSKDSSFLEEQAKWLANYAGSNDIVFIEKEAPDKRLRLYKIIEKNGKIAEFKPLNVNETINFIKSEVANRGGAIEQQAAIKLQLFCGNNLERVSSEIDKLLSLDKTITVSMIEKLVDPDNFSKIFDLTDAVSNRKLSQGIKCLNLLLARGEEPLAILAMLGTQSRNLLIVFDLKNHGLNESEIQAKSKLHPFVVKKLISQVGNFNKDQLLDFHKNILDADIAIKNGLADPNTILNNLVFKTTKKKEA